MPLVFNTMTVGVQKGPGGIKEKKQSIKVYSAL